MSDTTEPTQGWPAWLRQFAEESQRHDDHYGLLGAADEIERLQQDYGRLEGLSAAQHEAIGAQGREIERLREELGECREQLREQTKSFCTHCGKLFDKGKAGLALFREHIVCCNQHPLHPMAKEMERLLEENERLQTLSDELREISVCPPHSTLAAWMKVLYGALGESNEMRCGIERLHSWDGLLELLDEHWPEDIFPVGGETDERRDTGARLVAAVRWIERLTAEIEDIRSLQDAEHDSQMGIRK